VGQFSSSVDSLAKRDGRQRVFCAGWSQLGQDNRWAGIVPEADCDDVRELIYQGYRIIYLVARPEQVFIVTIIHGSRNLAGEEIKPWDVG